METRLPCGDQWKAENWKFLGADQKLDVLSKAVELDYL